MTQNEVQYLFFILVMIAFAVVWAVLQRNKNKQDEQKMYSTFLNDMLSPFDRFRRGK